MGDHGPLSCPFPSNLGFKAILGPDEDSEQNFQITGKVGDFYRALTDGVIITGSAEEPYV